MSGADLWLFVKQFGGPFASSTVFVLALFIGFCVVFGFTKTKKTAGGSARVVKSLDERISHQADGVSGAECAARPGRPAAVTGTSGGSRP